MAVTKEELADFNRFATDVLANGGAESMQQLVSEWQEYRETVADIQEGLADVEAGRFKPVDQAFADIRKKLGWDE